MKTILTAATAATAAQAFATAGAAPAAAVKPAVVLVHGAFGDSSSWDGVAARLQADGTATPT